MGVAVGALVAGLSVAAFVSESFSEESSTSFEIVSVSVSVLVSVSFSVFEDNLTSFEIVSVSSGEPTSRM